MNSLLTLAIIALLTASSLVLVGSVSAQPIPKPSVPEFTVKVVDNSYETEPKYSMDPYTGKQVQTQWGGQTQIGYIEISIKNQPFLPYNDGDGHYIDLYYSIKFKGHFTGDWDNGYKGYLKNQSDTAYTTLIIRYGADSSRSGPHLGYLAMGAQFDFRVNAEIGYWTRIEDYANFTDVFTGEVSDWGAVQTVMIPYFGGSASTSPTVSTRPFDSSTPTVWSTQSGDSVFFRDFDWIAVVAVVSLGFVAVLTLVVVVLGRRIRRLERKVIS